MANIDLSILNDLTAFDSATVQNAAIRIRGYINESDDYSGTSLKRYTGEMPTIVGVATTVKAKALHKPSGNEGTVAWKDYYEKISAIELPFISISCMSRLLLLSVTLMSMLSKSNLNSCSSMKPLLSRSKCPILTLKSAISPSVNTFKSVSRIFSGK